MDKLEFEGRLVINIEKLVGSGCISPTAAADVTVVT